MKIFFTSTDKKRYKKYLDLNIKYTELGLKIDVASDKKDLLRLQAYATECQRYIDITTDPLELAILYYFKANALCGSKKSKSWNWCSKIEGQALLAIRNAVRYAEKVQTEIPPQDMARKYTNLANETDFAGLFIEAGELYEKALSFQPNKGVALLNKGISLYYYLQYLFEEELQQIFVREASFWFKEAMRIGKTDLLEEKVPIERLKSKYKYFFESPKLVRLKEFTEPISFIEPELSYRVWVAKHRLFLNPLNDICPEATNLYPLEDRLKTPSFCFVAGSKREFLPLRINQIKQEFIAARTLFFEGIEAQTRHYSDNLTHLETHPLISGNVYAFNLEKIKWALRSTYSLFDKIAGIIADIYLSEECGKAYFRRFWYENGDINRPLKSFFSTEPKSQNFNRSNLALRALFSIANDFSSSEEQWQNSIDEEMKDITTIRNALEHEGVEILKMGESNVAARIITFKDLVIKTMYLLKKCRNSIIYLILAINCEAKLEKEKDNEKKIPIQGTPYSIDKTLDGGIKGLAEICYTKDIKIK